MRTPRKSISVPMLPERSRTISIAIPLVTSRTFSCPLCGRARATTRSAIAATRSSAGSHANLVRNDPPARAAAFVEEKRIVPGLANR